MIWIILFLTNPFLFLIYTVSLQRIPLFISILVLPILLHYCAAELCFTDKLISGAGSTQPGEKWELSHIPGEYRVLEPFNSIRGSSRFPSSLLVFTGTGILFYNYVLENFFLMLFLWEGGELYSSFYLFPWYRIQNTDIQRIFFQRDFFCPQNMIGLLWSNLGIFSIAKVWRVSGFLNWSSRGCNLAAHLSIHASCYWKEGWQDSSCLRFFLGLRI